MGRDEPDPSLKESLIVEEIGPVGDELDITWTQGEQQPKQCRDAAFAFLFYGHVAAILALGLVWGLPAVGTEISDDTVKAYYGIIYVVLLTAGASFLVSMIVLLFMMYFAKVVIQFSLLFTLVTTFATMVYLFYIGINWAGILSTLSFVATLFYVRYAWKRIPFAAANLVTGLTAVRKNCGVTFVAYFLSSVSVLYTALWALCYTGVQAQSKMICENNGKDCVSSINWGYIFLLLLVLFWTQQVVQNTIHVTVAGTVGTWWFDPSVASSCCSKGIWESFGRASTLSFGSICLGSLFVALIQALRAMVEMARSDPDSNAILLCITSCLLSCIQGIMEYFNKWAFVYVGLYGDTYLKSGQKVMTLFEQRGWSTIINDNLVSNALSLSIFVIGLLVGCIGLILPGIYPTWFDGFDDARATAFFIGFLVGAVIASVMIAVVDSAVNTVIVCFAENPNIFQDNHPALSDKLRSTWQEIYPIESGF